MADVNSAGNKLWNLVALKGEAIKTEKPPTMKFAEGKLSIFGGINRLSGSYALLDDQVIMGEIVSTKKAGPEALMAMEREFAKILRSVDGFHVHGPVLELLSNGEVVATFEEAE